MNTRAWFAPVCLIVATMSFTTASLAQPQTVLRELAQHLAGAGATILVGELPPEKHLGFDFPLPKGARVVGANVWSDADP